MRPISDPFPLVFGYSTDTVVLELSYPIIQDCPNKSKGAGWKWGHFVVYLRFENYACCIVSPLQHELIAFLDDGSQRVYRKITIRTNHTKLRLKCTVSFPQLKTSADGFLVPHFANVTARLSCFLVTVHKLTPTADLLDLKKDR